MSTDAGRVPPRWTPAASSAPNLAGAVGTAPPGPPGAGVSPGSARTAMGTGAGRAAGSSHPGALSVGTSLAADELRGTALGAEGGARRRDDVGARRGASAHRLMGAVVRRLLEEADEERVEEGASSVGEGGTALPLAGGSDRIDRLEVRRTVAPGRSRRAALAGTRPISRHGQGGQPEAGDGPDSTVAQTVSSAAGGEGGVWATPSRTAGEVAATALVAAPQTRITPVGRRDRLAPDRAVAPERVGRSSGMAKLSWGAVLAAVVALVVVLLIGGFDAPGTEGAGPASERQGRTTKPAQGQ